MKCDKFQDALRAMHTWDRPDDDLPAELRQHAGTCVACSDEWDRVHRLKAALSSLAHESSAGAPPALEGRLVEAFREHHRQAAAPFPGSSRVSSAWLPMAAGIVLAVAAASWYVARPAAPAAKATAREVQASQPAVTASASSPRVAAVSRTRPQRERRAAAEEQQTARAAESAPPMRPRPAVEPAAVDREPDDVSGEFVTLPYGTMPTDEDVHVVQIDVPRESLYDFGSASQSATAASDLVTADVLIGEDGAPRAFRIVEPGAATVTLERQQSPLQARSPRP